MRKLLVILCLLNCVCVAEAVELKTAAQESTPKYYLHNRQMRGLCVDLINAIESIDPGLKFSGYEKFAPLTRIEAGLEEGIYDVFFGLIKTDEREEKFTFVDPPLYVTHTMLGVRADDDVVVKSLDDVRRLDREGVVLAVRGTGHIDFLQRQGVRIDAGAKANSDNLNKLLAGRGRFVYHTDISLVAELMRGQLERRIRVLPMKIKPEPQYLAVSKRLSQDVVARLGKAVALLQTNGMLEKIFSRYRKVDQLTLSE
jgi:polar amino acid transport system substrate-binding protein